ncbi:MAG: hypothetical protein J5922_05415 [Clostridia bacterium]|nr:hypothetical protein [Clostridia bacterium]
MGFGYILAGILFFFNPFVNIADFLPDFIGCALIMHGLLKLRCLSDYIEDAYNYFAKLFWTSLIKFALWLISVTIKAFGIESLLLSDGIMILLYTSIFGLFEAYLLFMGIKKMFSAFESFERYDKRSTMLTGISSVLSLSFVFILARSFLPILPEFVSLSNSNSAYVNLYVYDTGKFKTFFSVFAVCVVFFLGILWLIYQTKYFYRLIKDGELKKALVSEYEQFCKTHVCYEMCNTVKFSYSLIVAGIAFFADVHLYYFDILPELIGGLFVIFAVFFLSKHSKAVTARTKAISVIFALLFALADALKYFAAYKYRHDYRDMSDNLAALKQNMIFAQAITALLSIAFWIWLIIKFLHISNEFLLKKTKTAKPVLSAVFLSLMSVLQVISVIFSDDFGVIVSIVFAYSIFAVVYAGAYITDTSDKISRLRKRTLN